MIARWRNKGDRTRALQDFGTAIKLNAQHDLARANYRSLAQRLGAQMTVKNKPGPPYDTASRDNGGQIKSIVAHVVMAGQKARSAVFAPDVPAIHVLLF